MDKSTLSAILVDDEKYALTNLSNLIVTYCPFINVIDTANNVETALQKINTLKPDVIFLDVNMPQQNGFDMLSQLNHLPLVVFVTAHEQYALRAMKACAVDFLLKPIDIAELVETEVKLLQHHAIKPEIRENYRTVLNNLTDMLAKPGSVRKITLPSVNGFDILNVDDIVYLSGEDNYTSFHFFNQKELMSAKTLKEYEEMLEHYGFMRIHKSTLINLSHIKKIIQKDAVEVQMKDGTMLHVSRRKATDILEWAKKQIN